MTLTWVEPIIQRKKKYFPIFSEANLIYFCFRAKSKDFEFLKVIGKGSFGQVYLTRHIKEDKLYAMKILKKESIIKRNEQRHIMAERNVLIRNLTHPFLVGLHYSFQSADKLYFVLDYVNGGEVFVFKQIIIFFSIL